MCVRYHRVEFLLSHSHARTLDIGLFHYLARNTIFCHPMSSHSVLFCFHSLNIPPLGPLQFNLSSDLILSSSKSSSPLLKFRSEKMAEFCLSIFRRIILFAGSKYITIPF